MSTQKAGEAVDELPELPGRFAGLDDGGVDAGLSLLELAIPAGVELTQAEIAYVCGCSRAYIYYLERKAMKKLRRAFERRGLGEKSERAIRLL